MGAFLFTVGAVYNEFGNSIAQGFESERKDIADVMKKVDDSLLAQVKADIATNKGMLDLEEDVKSVHALTDDMAVVQADYLTSLEEHKYREAVAKKLDALAALEDTASNAIRTRMLTNVHSDVISTFKTDAKAKDAALQQAIAVLSAVTPTKSATIGKDVVGDYFNSSLKKYKDAYNKQPAGSDAILAQLEKDAAAIMHAPVVTSKGGNVYEFKQTAAASAH